MALPECHYFRTVIFSQTDQNHTTGPCFLCTYLAMFPIGGVDYPTEAGTGNRFNETQSDSFLCWPIQSIAAES